MDGICRFSLGIFAYLNFCVPRKRKYILQLLISGLQRLEYRGYDSAGLRVYLDCFLDVLFLFPQSIYSCALTGVAYDGLEKMR